MLRFRYPLYAGRARRRLTEDFRNGNTGTFSPFPPAPFPLFPRAARLFFLYSLAEVDAPSAGMELIAQQIINQIEGNGLLDTPADEEIR